MVHRHILKINIRGKNDIKVKSLKVKLLLEEKLLIYLFSSYDSEPLLFIKFEINIVLPS